MLARPRRLATSVRRIPDAVKSKVQARNIAMGKPTTNNRTARVETQCGRNSWSTTVTTTSVTPQDSAP